MQPLPGIHHCGTRDRLRLRLLTVAGWAERRSQIAHSHPQRGLDVSSAHSAPPLAWLFNLNQGTKLQDELSQVNSGSITHPPTPPGCNLVQWNWVRMKQSSSSDAAIKADLRVQGLLCRISNRTSRWTLVRFRSSVREVWQQIFRYLFLCVNCSESRESVTRFRGGGKVRGWRRGAVRPEQLSFRRRFWATWWMRRGPILTLNVPRSVRLCWGWSHAGFRDAHSLATTFQWVYSKCNNPNDDARVGLVLPSSRVKCGGLKDPLPL